MKRRLIVLLSVALAVSSAVAQDAMPAPGAATPGAVAPRTTAPGLGAGLGLGGRHGARHGARGGVGITPFGGKRHPGRGGMFGARGAMATPGMANPGVATPGTAANATGFPARTPLGGRTATPAIGAGANLSETSSGDDAEKEKEGAPALNFNGATLDMVFDIYQGLVKKTIIRDPQLPNATITLISRRGQQLSDEEQIKAIEAVLEMNGVHLEDYDENFIRAMPRKDARTEGIPLIMDMERKLGESVRVVSMMIQFKNIAIDEAQKALEGFKSKMGILLVFERTNSILVTDTEMNVNRMLEIAKAIDVASPVLESVFVRQIKSALATDIQMHLQKIVEESMKEQEKNGKANAAAAALQNRQAMMQPPRLLGGRPNPAAANLPVNNPSLVMNVSDADRGMIRGKVLILADERSNKLIIVTMKPNMDFFDKVIEQLDVETTPDTLVKVYRLKYAEAEEVSDMINDLIGNAPSGKNTKGNQNPAARGGGANLTARTPQPAQRRPANQRTGDSKAGELSKDNTTVLADKRINGIVVMTQKELVPTIESIIESMDVKLSQVLIETAIIEVTLGDDLNTGVDWVQRGRTRAVVQDTDALGAPRYRLEETLSDGSTRLTGYSASENEYFDETRFSLTQIPSLISKTLRDGLVNHNNYMLGGGAGGAKSGMLSALVNAAGSVATNAAEVTPIGSGINYLFKSDKLNLAAIINATKSDTRANYIASPVVMTVDNKEATIDATEARKFFAGYETSSSYSTYVRTPKYDSKDIGIKIKVKPKINPNGTVMLNVEEEYSQLGAGQSILIDDGGTATIDTAVTRKMTADVLLDDKQTVVLGGLTEKYTSEKETGIPFLKDIPWIGKWLFGSVSQTETRKELLVFMTPYVLDDAEAAQLEALRRKKSMSVARPWSDNGWSASALADPVSQKEQVRRLKEEWAKQDEERQAKLAIEKMKVDRVKALKDLSEAERKMWLDVHKDELDKEARERLEKELQDPESQAKLKEIVEQVKQRKLAEAEEEIKAAEKLVPNENERMRLDAEAAKKAANPKPAETKPVAVPAPAKPVEVKPAPAKPAEVKPAPVKPAEVKPAAKPAKETR